MKIAIDGRQMGQRGVGRYVSNLVAGLAKADRKNSYTVLMDGRTPKVRAGFLPRVEFRVVSAPHRAWWEQVSVPRLLERERFDLAHFTDNTAPLRMSVPYVVTVHDTLFLRPLRDTFRRPTFHQRLADGYRKGVIPEVARRAAGVITVSEYSARQIERALHVPRKRITVAREACDPFFLKRYSAQAIRAVRELKGLPEKYLLTYGAMDLRKNTSLMLEVLALLRRQGFPHHLAVLGLPPFEVRRGGFRREARRLRVEEFVRFLDAVSDAEMAALYQGADVFLYPSRGEGFGLPVLEAMASGTPVAGSDATSIPEVAGDAALLLPSWDRQAWVEGVTRILENKVFRKRSITKGQTRVGKYSWKETVEKTLKVYKGVCG